MNSKEYKRALTKTRKAIYSGDLKGAMLGALHMLVAHNDPEAEPRPRQLPAARVVKRVRGEVTKRK